MNKLSRSEVVQVLNLDLDNLKLKFKARKIKSQKRRSIRSWKKLLDFCGIIFDDCE